MSEETQQTLLHEYLAVIDDIVETNILDHRTSSLLKNEIETLQSDLVVNHSPVFSRLAVQELRKKWIHIVEKFRHIVNNID